MLFTCSLPCVLARGVFLQLWKCPTCGSESRFGAPQAAASQLLALKCCEEEDGFPANGLYRNKRFSPQSRAENSARAESCGSGVALAAAVGPSTPIPVSCQRSGVSERPQPTLLLALLQPRVSTGIKMFLNSVFLQRDRWHRPPSPEPSQPGFWCALGAVPACQPLLPQMSGVRLQSN